jgi:Uma2 family endonuclease
MTKKPPHRISTGLTRQALARVVPANWYVDTQEPITLEDSEPEPDVVVVRGNTRDYQDGHPGAQDVALVVEVSDTTLERDRGTKRRIYARAGILVYWLINLIENRVEVYTNPTGATDEPDYQQQQFYSASDTLPLIIEGTEVGQIAVRDLLP